MAVTAARRHCIELSALDWKTDRIGVDWRWKSDWIGLDWIDGFTLWSYFTRSFANKRRAIYTTSLRFLFSETTLRSQHHPANRKSCLEKVKSLGPEVEGR